MKHGAWSGLLARRQKNERMEYAARKRRFRVKNLVNVDKNLSFCYIWKTHTCVIWGIILFSVNLHLIPLKNTSSFMQHHHTFCYEQAYVFVWNSWFLDVRNHMCSIEHHTCFFWNSMFFCTCLLLFSKKTNRFHLEFHTFFCAIPHVFRWKSIHFSMKFHMFSVKVRTFS